MGNFDNNECTRVPVLQDILWPELFGNKKGVAEYVVCNLNVFQEFRLTELQL